MENVYLDLIQWRAIERLLSIIIGGLSIAAGWHLFLRGVIQEHTADIQLQTFKVGLQKVGPGIFFAIFGAGLIVNICTTQATIENFKLDSSNSDIESSSPTEKTSITFLANAPEDWELKFVAIANRIASEYATINQGLEKISDKDGVKIQSVQSSIMQLDQLRKHYLITKFPPELRDYCRGESPLPKGFSIDSCQLMNEYENAIIN